mmetsp:Transcript_3976/g.6225  ORF Transcript_3976/g.6225 Transcript_3976/m.6225 type:complete len:228 (+) Transcript_3976:459-1142(+)
MNVTFRQINIPQFLKVAWIKDMNFTHLTVITKKIVYAIFEFPFAATAHGINQTRFAFGLLSKGRNLLQSMRIADPFGSISWSPNASFVKTRKIWFHVVHVPLRGLPIVKFYGILIKFQRMINAGPCSLLQTFPTLIGNICKEAKGLIVGQLEIVVVVVVVGGSIRRRQGKIPQTTYGYSILGCCSCRKEGLRYIEPCIKGKNEGKADRVSSFGWFSFPSLGCHSGWW